MYYPLLRARQFELIALRELSSEDNLNHIIPILEPVKNSFNNFKLAFDIFQNNSDKVFLIMNPVVGEISGDLESVCEFISEFDSSCELIRPAFHFRNNSDFIQNSIRKYNFKNCMILCSGSTNPDDDDFIKLIDLNQINEVVVEDPSSNRDLNRFMLAQEKSYIRLDDLFEKEVRNSDFLDLPERKFSEEHIYFKEENFDGFSDYTVLPSEFSYGGSAPRAVVLHFSYLKRQNNQIWIKHFTSITNDSIANVQGKFAEATKKALEFCKSNNLNNSAITELRDYYNREHYPGLGMVKKISIKNHIQVINNFLESIS